MWALAALFGIALTLAATHVVALDPGQLTATPLPILSTATSAPAAPELPLPTSSAPSAPLPTSSGSLPKQAPSPPPDLEGALPTIGEGQSTTESPSPTTSSSPSSGGGGPGVSAGNDDPQPSPSPTMTSKPSSDSGAKPSYTGGFYTKPASASKPSSAVVGPPNPQDVALGQQDHDAENAAGGGESSGASQADSQQASAQQGPASPIATVPGPGAAIVFVLLAALALVLLRRRAL